MTRVIDSLAGVLLPATFSSALLFDLGHAKLQIVPKVDVAIDECWVPFNQGIKGYTKAFRLFSLEQIGLHTCLEQQRVWHINFAHVLNTRHIFFDLVL